MEWRGSFRPSSFSEQRSFSSAAGGKAQAQFGYGAYPGYYGGYGWGGWGAGATAEGSIAQGLGALAVGEGQYNVDTAVANQINSQTIGAYNEFMFLSQQEANERERLRMNARMKRDAHASDAAYQRIRTAPTPDDIANGSALNAVLDQVNDPRIHSSALRLADAPIAGKVVRSIPFAHASDAVTISLNQLTAKDGWPIALRGDTFANERAAYQNAVARALKEDEEGDLTPANIQAVQNAALALRVKLAKNPPADPKERVEAQTYIRALVGMSHMLDKPRVDKILAELDMVKKTTLGSLLGFMYTFNLRFAPATTPDQRAVYEQLYPLMAAQRDRLVKESGIGDDAAPPARKERPVNFFQGLHLESKKSSDDANSNQ